MTSGNITLGIPSTFSWSLNHKIGFSPLCFLIYVVYLKKLSGDIFLPHSSQLIKSMSRIRDDFELEEPKVFLATK